ncbi:MAG TPA: 50S ribosomal protein L32e [Candidatus Poseidoniaceae archaeon]|nr:MAG TPA: 50S ribosomal protein L32e [Candidatus Poseidoniales archaeon]HII38155.1 50S ribosomal protein L32e [Candidatus Poseidoniaceae archaeon]|tara:strand:+ start:1561 stop:2220 length:660 start_codon:yes stop_codon:yes gene_type:complete
MAEEYEGMTVAELKVLLKERGLPVSGKKSELIERLSHEQEDVAEPEELESTAVDETATEDDFEADEDEDWDDDWEDDEDEGHVAKQKPVLSDDLKVALALRFEQKKKTPSFRRTEWFRYKRLSRSGWRAPHGMDSKQRRNYKYRSSLVRVGHGKVAVARGLHPSGFREIMVHNTGDLETIDPETEAARVGKTVGGRKREQIYSRADELGIRVLNRRRDV